MREDSFVETYNYNDFAEAGLDMKFVPSDNLSLCP